MKQILKIQLEYSKFLGWVANGIFQHNNEIWETIQCSSHSAAFACAKVEDVFMQPIETWQELGCSQGRDEFLYNLLANS